ncbi:FAD-dependent oxidoreductase [Streptomyces sp. CS62]|uniref:FAD-dependent oxidoreductase n=1 Tax=Streptomyces sp. CS62 TaxID=3119268 RepID=UPI002F94E23C
MSPVVHAHADAVVVGGGVIGAAIAHRLALAGLGRIVLCDQGRVSAQGATSRSGGLLRLHHTSVADTRLAARSLPVFEQWADVIGGDCGYRRTGFVMIVGEGHADGLRQNAAAASDAAGYRRTEVVDAAELKALYPGFCAPRASGSPRTSRRAATRTPSPPPPRCWAPPTGSGCPPPRASAR